MMNKEVGGSRGLSNKRRFTSLAVLAAVAATSVWGYAATVSTESELISAINSKDADIRIPANTTIKLTGTLPAISFKTTIHGGTDGTSIIDGQGQYTIFSVTSGASDVVIEGITLQNAKSSGSARGGAAIRNEGSLKVSQCHFENNVVDMTGENTVAGMGGAIYSTARSSLVVSQSSFWDNVAQGANGRQTAEGNLNSTIGTGGAIFADGAVTIENCTFSGNQAKGGNGIGKNPLIAGGAGAHAEGGAIGIGPNATSANLVFLTMVNNKAKGGDTEISSAGGEAYGGKGRGGAMAFYNTGTTIKSVITIGSVQQDGIVTASLAPDIYGDFVDAGGNLFNVSATTVQTQEVSKNGTKVYPITTSSAAYGAGAVDDRTVDQRGVRRPRTVVAAGKTGFDSGAYQIPEVTIVAEDKMKVYGTPNPDLTWHAVDVWDRPLSGAPMLTTTAETMSPVGNYPINASIGTLDTTYYTYRFVDANLTIVAAEAIAVAEDKTKVYGTPNPDLTYHVIAKDSGATIKGSTIDNISLATTATQTSPAGGYPIDWAQKTITVPNYVIVDWVPATLTITTAQAIAIAEDKSKVYGTPNPDLTYRVIAMDGTVLRPSTVDNVSLATTATLMSDVGSYPITWAQKTITVPNYEIVEWRPATLTITAADAVAVAEDKSKIYGEPNPDLTYHVIAKDSGTVIKGSTVDNISLTTTATQTSPVGSYPITWAAQTVTVPNYRIVEWVPAKLTITLAEAIAIAEDKSKIYGTVNPDLTYHIIAKEDGRILRSSTVDNVSLATTAVKDSPVGSYPIDWAQKTITIENYTIVEWRPATLTITAANAIAIAEDKTKVFGADNPDLTYHVIATDGTVIRTSTVDNYSLTTTAVKDSPAGSYPITWAQKTITVPNYKITEWRPATLTITAAEAIAIAENKSKVYGTDNPDLTYYVVTKDGGTVLRPSTVDNVSLTTTATKTSPVGSYPITWAKKTITVPNYTIVEWRPATLTITMAEAIAIAEDKSKVYGTDNPDLTYHVIDKATGTTIKGSTVDNVSLTTTAVKDSPVGKYPITWAQKTITVENYTIVEWRPANLTITEANAIAIAEDKTKVYGTDNPDLTYHVIATDGTVIRTSTVDNYSLTTTAVKDSPAGSYPITWAQKTITVPNYKITEWRPATLTITAAEAIAIAENKSKVYGTDNPDLTYYVVTKDGGTVLRPSTVDNVSLTTTATKTSPVGSYPITWAKKTITVPNYTIVEWRPATLTVTYAEAIAIAEDKSKVYGEDNPDLTYHVIAKEGGATIKGSTVDNVSLTTTATKTSDVGSYPITWAQKTITVENYTIVEWRPATLTITDAEAIAIAEDKERPYGVDNPDLTYHVIAKVSGATLRGSTVDNVSLTTTATKTSDVGEYPITWAQKTITVPNYKIVEWRPATLTIKRIKLLAALPGTTRYYGEENYEATVDYLPGTPLATWTKEDLVFVQDGVLKTYAELEDSFIGEPIFFTVANKKSSVGNYYVEVYWGSFYSINADFVDKDGNILDHWTSAAFADNVEFAKAAKAQTGKDISTYLKVLPVDLDIHAYADPNVITLSSILRAFMNQTNIVDKTLKYYYGTMTEDGELVNFFVNGDTESCLISYPRARLMNRFEDLRESGVYEVTPYGAQSKNYNIHRYNGNLIVFDDINSRLEEGPVPQNYDATGLYEQIVLVKNADNMSWIGIDLYANGVTGATIKNAVKDLGRGNYILNHNYDVVPGEVVAFVVEYQMTSKEQFYANYPTFTFTPRYAEAGDSQEVYELAEGKPVSHVEITFLSPERPYGPTNPAGFIPEDWTFSLEPEGTPAYGLKYLERYGWAAWVNVGMMLRADDVTPGQMYEVQYSDVSAMGPWTAIVPQVQATGNILFWVDKGAPKTEDHPIMNGTKQNRYYRIIEVE